METARPNAANNPAAMTNGETSEDLDAIGDEGNLHGNGRKGFGESEIQDSNALLVLLGGADGTENDVTHHTETSKPISTDNQNLLVLLGGLDLSSPAPAPIAVQNNSILLSTNQSSNFLMDDLLNSEPVRNNLPSITAYEKNGLRIVFSLERLPENPNTTVITLSATNETLSTISEFLFQAAVPKTFQLQMLSPSSTVIAPADQLTQVLRITNPNKTPLRMRIRVSYNAGGTVVQDQAEVNNFPPESWQ